MCITYMELERGPLGNSFGALKQYLGVYGIEID